MKHVRLPDIATAPDAALTAEYRRYLGFYLALEEWTARNIADDDCFFTWIVPKTVIIGRNQDLQTEVNVPYCHRNGIEIVRRRSGGGCVYADENNIMFSLIVPAADVSATFTHCIDRMAGQLRKIGLNAEATGRNDILVDGRKISGNAYYHMPGRAIVHGTMLYRTDPVHISHAITPSRAKLESKRVTSVESRIVTASELLPGWTLDRFHAALTDGIADSEVTLTHDQEAEVRALADRYRRPEWLLGFSPRAHNLTVHTARFEGVGEISAAVTTAKDGLIDGVHLTGDFFMLSDLDTIVKPLIGTLCEATALRRALDGVDVGAAIPGLTTENLVTLLTK